MLEIFFSSWDQQQTQEETMSALGVVGALRRDRCSGMNASALLGLLTGPLACLSPLPVVEGEEGRSWVVAALVCIPTNSVRGFPFLHTLSSIYYL